MYTKLEQEDKTSYQSLSVLLIRHRIWIYSSAWIGFIYIYIYIYIYIKGASIRIVLAPALWSGSLQKDPKIRYAGGCSSGISAWGY
jgi:hypothetical protein